MDGKAISRSTDQGRGTQVLVDLMQLKVQAQQYVAEGQTTEPKYASFFSGAKHGKKAHEKVRDQVAVDIMQTLSVANAHIQAGKGNKLDLTPVFSHVRKAIGENRDIDPHAIATTVDQLWQKLVGAKSTTTTTTTTTTSTMAPRANAGHPPPGDVPPPPKVIASGPFVPKRPPPGGMPPPLPPGYSTGINARPLSPVPVSASGPGQAPGVPSPRPLPKPPVTSKPASARGPSAQPALQTAVAQPKKSSLPRLARPGSRVAKPSSVRAVESPKIPRKAPNQ